MRALDYVTGAVIGLAVYSGYRDRWYTCIALAVVAILLAIASWTREEEE